MDRPQRSLSAEVQRKLDRASTVAGTALAVHTYGDDGEQEVVSTCGTCAEACAYVSRLPWGAQSCRRSRESAAADAQQREKPVPFLCHMGFSCVSMSVALTPDETHVVTFGPFCPSAAPGSLELDARDGLKKIDRKNHRALPFDLSDIPLASADAVPEVAEWLSESLQSIFEEAAPDEETPDNAEATRTTRVHAVSSPLRDPYQASSIAAALAAGDQDQARALTRSLIQDVDSGKTVLPRVRRARATAVIAATLEAAERAGMNVDPAWDNFTRYQSTIAAAKDARDLTLAAMKVLGKLKRSAPANEGLQNAQAALNKVLDDHLADGINLQDAAKRLGENPSTVTKRLQRNFGMSFSEYAGRRRVDHAKDLLQKTRLSIAQVAQRVGLTDASNLGKLFRKHEGMSPGQYRKKFAIPKQERESRQGP